MYKDIDPKEQPLRAFLAADAAGWMFWDGTETVDEEGRYTFLHICTLLGVDGRAIREHALRLTPEDLRRFNGDSGL